MVKINSSINVIFSFLTMKSLLCILLVLGNYLKKTFRILWNVITFSEISKGYPDRALEILWNGIPHSMVSKSLVQRFGRLLYKRACRKQERQHSADYTRFFRNAPQLEVLRSIVLKKPRNSTLMVAILGCSTGAEVYSALSVIRKARPDLKVIAVGSDISSNSIKKACDGIYPCGTRELEGLSIDVLDSLLAREGDHMRVQQWMREGIVWRVDDACDPKLLETLGPQDIVMANNFLCHMSDSRAASCFRNIASLVAYGGHLFVWGMNLDVRTKIVSALGLIPLAEMVEEVYKADKTALQAWPLKYWGLEPIDKTRPDWITRYATVFEIPSGRTPVCGKGLEHTSV